MPATNLTAILPRQRKHFPKGRILIREGEVGDRAWLIEVGNFSVTVRNDLVATIGEGVLVGEMALIDGGPRTATVRAVTDASCLEFTWREFRRLIDACDPLIGCLLESLSDTVRRAQGLPQVNPRVRGLAREGGGGRGLKKFSSGDVIYAEGAEADCAYVILSGMVTIRKDFAEVVHHGPGRVIGELALLDNVQRAATAMAAETTICEVISRQRFQESLAVMPDILLKLAITYIDRIKAFQADTG